MRKNVVLAGLVCFAFLGFNFSGKRQLAPFKKNLPDFVARHFQSPNFPESDNPSTLEGFELGRKIFYDTRLSSTQTISCGSCHLPSFAFSDTARFSRGVHNTLGDRNSMSLANIGWGGRFFWDGRSASLREQIHEPVIDKREMNTTWADIIQTIQNDPAYQKAFKNTFPKEKIGETTIKKALEQFISNITSFNSKYDQYYYSEQHQIYNEQEKLGLKLFNSKAQCSNCHNTVLFTNNQFMNNGLDSLPNLGLYNATGNTQDRGLMKTPSLRNVGLTPPYMHDGRFNTLEDVLNFYNHDVNPSSPNIDFRMAPFTKKNGLQLSKTEKEAIIAFLHTLTDSSLILNPIYQNPW